MQRNMRLLMAVTIVMGVLILLGTTVVIVTIARRIATPRARPEDMVSLHLAEPAGTRVSGIAGAGDRLAVDVRPPDPATGHLGPAGPGRAPREGSGSQGAGARRAPARRVHAPA